jgi:MATE family multidrug resistance protein
LDEVLIAVIGLSTALDTLCAQAYGSGNKKLVGLHLQRMICFLMLCTIPIIVMWRYSEEILAALLPDRELARWAGLYLRTLAFGA